MLQIFRRFWLLLVPACALITLLIPILAHLFSSEEDVSPDVLSACAPPCFLGITAGTTLITEAEAVLRQHLPFDTQINLSNAIPGVIEISFNTIVQDQRVFGWVESVTDGAVIWEMNLQTNLPLYVLLDRLGTPECINLFPQDQRVALVIDWLGESIRTRALVVIDQTESWRPDALVEEVNVMMSGEVDCASQGMQRWRGFASIEWYLGNQ